MRTPTLSVAAGLVLVPALAALLAAAPGHAEPAAGGASTAAAGGATAAAGAATTGDAAAPGAAPHELAGAQAFEDKLATGALEAGAIKPCTASASLDAPEDGSLSGKIKNALAAGNIAIALVLVLFGGFLTALSPCVYPLIPITLSILGARQAGSHTKGFLLASTYVGGMVILYSTLGVAFAAFGFLAGSALQSPVVTIGVALFCMLMAASMFGAFELALPSSVQTRLSQAGGGGFKGAFIMGLVAGIIAAPCTGPVLSFILALIARDGSVAKGALLMLTYALGMGFPFLVLGTFSQAVARMPKSGRWMEVVKSIFGLLMLGAGLYYLRIGVPAVGDAFAPLGKSPWLGPALVVLGVLLGALHLSFKMSSSPEKARKAAGVALATLGIVSFIAWAVAGPAESAAGGIAWTVVKNEADGTAKVDAALAAAKKDCKPAMIDFFAEWCVACKELDHKTYVDGAVQQEAQRFAALKIDATDDSPALDALRKRYGVQGLPTVVFVDGNGTVRERPRITGFVDAPTYLELMKSVR